MVQVGTSPKEEESVGIFQTLVVKPPKRGGLGWMFYRIQSADYGLDGYIEALETNTAGQQSPSGKLLFVQIKGGPSYFRYDQTDSWRVYIPERTMAYWRKHLLPVLLVIIDLNSEKCYWVRADVGHRKTVRGYAISVPKANVLSSDAIYDLEDLISNIQPMPSKLAVLNSYAPIMKRIDAGEHLLVSAIRYGRGSRELDSVTIRVDKPSKFRKLQKSHKLPRKPLADIVWSSDAPITDIHSLFPWCTLNVNYEDGEPYDEYLVEECHWDNETGTYVDYSGHYDDWLEERTAPDGSVLANAIHMPDGGEKFRHTWELELNELGTSFLRVLDYVEE